MNTPIDVTESIPGEWPMMEFEWTSKISGDGQSGASESSHGSAHNGSNAGASIGTPAVRRWQAAKDYLARRGTRNIAR